MRLTPVDFLIGSAVWADAAFHLLYEPKGEAPLLATGASAHRAFHASLSHGAVTVGDFVVIHERLPPGSLAPQSALQSLCETTNCSGGL